MSRTRDTAASSQMVDQRVLRGPDGQRRAGAEVTAGALDASLADLDRRVRALRALGVRGRARAIAGLARWWLEVWDAPPPELAALLARGCQEAELSPEMLRWGVRETLGRWTEDALVALVEGELGGCAALEHDFGQSDDDELVHADGDARTMAIPPRLCLQVLARTVPPAGWQSVALAWLLGSAVLVRPSTHLGALMEAFALSLARAAPALAAVTWVSCSATEDAAWRHALGARADAVVVHGSHEAVNAWREAARPDAVLVAHGHRVSAAFLAAEGLEEPALSAHLRGLALDLCAWDQTGCLSPVTLYVAQGGPVTPEQVARRLAEEALPAVEAELPPGPWSQPVLAERTLFVRARLMEGQAYASRTAHVVALDRPGPLEGSCLHRVLLVRPVQSVDALVALLRASAPHLQALAVGGAGSTRVRLAEQLAASGLNRVCLPGHMQRPPLSWSHDGRGSLRPLVRWVDLA